MRSCNPHRQLNAEETRIYAAGMAAHRRGETKPRERLPTHLYALWQKGWRRVGHGIPTPVPRRTNNHNTLCEGIHCIHTEAETLDDALRIIEIQQRARKQSETNTGRSITWQHEARLDQGRKRQMKKRRELLAGAETYSDIEQRLVERVEQAIELLRFSVEEMSIVSALHTRHRGLNQHTLIDIIDKLCKTLGRPAPEFNVVRKPVDVTHTRNCVNCGAVLIGTEKEYCLHCRPENESVRIASELRREQLRDLAGMEREAKQLSAAIRGAEQAIKHGSDQGHGGHPGADSPSVEVGGREEDLDLGS
jgi:hypothetical protein